MQISEQPIWQMAKSLQQGHDIYLNKDTGEFHALPDSQQFTPEGLFRTDVHRQITDHWDHYLIISAMESWEWFEIMEDFAHEVDEAFHYQLLEVMYQHNPLDNFRRMVESSSYRPQWDTFRDERFFNYVRDYLKSEDIETED